ncbi:MAG: FAD-binding oxidoreductase [Micromonosporaceae bacterium]
MRKSRLTRRRLLTHTATAAGGLAAGGAGTAAVRDWAAAGEIPPPAPPRDLLDDASRLNPTPVRGILYADADADATADRVRPLLRRISAGDDPPLAIAGARHSMGGQSMHRGGWMLDTVPMRRVEVGDGVMRVGAGATWREVIPILNAAGYAPAVMQSNHDFTVGGSLSVNCHGWQTDRPPIASTVRELRVLTADGTVVSCGPRRNADLFRLVLGGYGLFGVILDAKLDIVPNVLYTPHQITVPTSEYAAVFASRVYAPGSPVEMAYGRLSVDPLRFLEEAILVAFTPVPGTRGSRLPLNPAGASGKAGPRGVPQLGERQRRQGAAVVAGAPRPGSADRSAATVC